MAVNILQNKVIGSLIGLAVGDALGAPYEFRKPPYDTNNDYIEGGAHSVSIGEWTDDTSMALCIPPQYVKTTFFKS